MYAESNLKDVNEARYKKLIQMTGKTKNNKIRTTSLSPPPSPLIKWLALMHYQPRQFRVPILEMLKHISWNGGRNGVCSPPAKLRQHLFVLQTSIIDQRNTSIILPSKKK